MDKDKLDIARLRIVWLHIARQHITRLLTWRYILNESVFINKDYARSEIGAGTGLACVSF
jgi:hypothetical protein